MSATSERAGAVLAQHEEAVFGEWVRAAGERLRGRMSTDELATELRAVFDSVVRGAASEGTEDLSETRAVLAELSRSRARQGFTPTETAVAITSLKEPLGRLVSDGTLAMDDYLAVSDVVDELGLVTFDSYVRAREVVIAEQAEQLLELSTPVIKLWDGIVAVPLVGTLDSARTQVVMENLLQTLVDTGSEHAILDITGVPAVDTQVAQHLLKTVVAARLMGAECVISGIRPQIAQTIVALGIEFGDIATKATLADALLACLQRSGLDVGRRLNG